MRVLLQSEREVSSRDARSSFSESDLFSECLTVPPGFCNRWIYRKIMQTPPFSKLLQILLLDASCDVIAMRIQRKVVSQFKKWNEQLCVLFMHDFQELHWTNEPKAEQIRATRLGYRPFICSDRRRGLLLITRHRYTQRWEIVKKVTLVELAAESITFLSDLVRSIQIRHIIMLKLQISEQTPLMWKTGETLFNKHKSPPFTINLI